MRNPILPIIMLVVMAGGLNSCSRVQVTPDDHMEGNSSCTHSSLEHHPATSPTYEECGNVEYWQCRDCGRRFSGPDAKTPFTGYIYLLPTRFVDLSAAYEQSPTKSAVSSITAVVCVVGLIATVAGYITSVVSLVDETEQVAKDIDELADQEDKKQEQIKLLEELNDEICEKLPELDSLLTLCQGSVHDLVIQMNETQKLMDYTETLEDEVLLAILEAEQDIEEAKLLDSRYKSLQDLKFACVSAYRAMDEYLTRACSAIGYAQTRSDSLAVFSDMRRNIINVVGSWGSERACYPSQTSTLMAEFTAMTYDDGTSVLDMLTRTATDVLPFDHDIVVIKKLFSEREICIMALGTCLSSCYYRNCCGKGNLYASKTAEAMEKNLDRCKELRDVFYEKWNAESNVGPWHCNVTGRYFQPRIVWMNAGDFVSENTMNMKNEIMVSSSKPLSIFYVVSEEDALTELEWELIRKDYLLHTGAEAQRLDSLLFSKDRPGMVFEDTVYPDYARTVRNMAFSIPYSSNEYFSLGGNYKAYGTADIHYSCTGLEMDFCQNIVEYSVVSDPQPNGSNYCRYLGNNGLTRFYTVQTSSSK